MADVDNNTLPNPDPKASRYASLGPKRRPSTPRPDINKYERLEDLLREAGYKETRIFTPECTPVPTSKQPSKPLLDEKSRLGSVVNLFSSLVKPSSRQDRPPSKPVHGPDVEQITSPASSSSSLSPSVSRRHLPNGRPSKAQAYLKHMSSAPNLPQRRRPQSAHDSFKKAKETQPPPLPQSWLETVARAVLFGGESAYVGGPAPGGAPPLRHVQSTIDDARPVRGLGLDLEYPPETPTPRGRQMASNDVRIHAGKLQLRDDRSGHSQIEVSLTSVTCQSAPTSRASSRARSGRKRTGRAQQPQQPPSLARTTVENDGWASDDQVVQRLPIITVHHQVNNRRARLLADDSDSEGEGEITLDRLLIPPKRQNSIRSLRRHLTMKDSFSDLRQARPPTPEVREEQGEEDEDGEMNRRLNRGKPRRGIPRWN